LEMTKANEANPFKALLPRGWTGRFVLFTCVALAVVGGGMVVAANGQPVPISPNPPGESPELGRAGDLAVGTSVVQYALQDRVKITLMGAVTGRLPSAERRQALPVPAIAMRLLPRASRHLLLTRRASPLKMEHH
jgi:hypothetical protein